MISKPEIYEFMNSCPLMVISTVNKAGQPQSALVGFGQTGNLELIFGTSELSRKARNIVKNGRVSVVIGWEDRTIQLEGSARMLEGEEENQLSEQYFKKSEAARKFKDAPHERYFLITPSWLRFTNATTRPWSVDELEF